MKKRIVYQAGYTSGTNSWLVVGYGYTLVQARRALNIRLDEKITDKNGWIFGQQYIERSYEEEICECCEEVIECCDCKGIRENLDAGLEASGMQITKLEDEQ